MSTVFRPDLSKVSILIKTFLRDAHLECAVAGIQATMPEVQMIVVDDGERSARKSALYDRLHLLGHKVIELPFDSGFGAKSNAMIGHLERPYVLIGSDDFDFNPPMVRQGIEKLFTVLENDMDVVIASGRVNGNRYEGVLHDQGSRIVEEYIKFDMPRSTFGVTYHLCNLTVNYSLMCSDILGHDKIHWDDDVKIGGGEHGAFFVDVMRAGHRVAYVSGVDIREQEGFKLTDPRYASFRARASQPGRKCFARRGIKEYVMFGGGVEHA